MSDVDKEKIPDEEMDGGKETDDGEEIDDGLTNESRTQVETLGILLGRKHINARKFARSIQVSDKTFTDYMQGRTLLRDAKAITVYKIAKGLDCSIEVLLGLEDVIEYLYKKDHPEYPSEKE